MLKIRLISCSILGADFLHAVRMLKNIPQLESVRHHLMYRFLKMCGTQVAKLGWKLKANQKSLRKGLEFKDNMGLH